MSEMSTIAVIIVPIAVFLIALCCWCLRAAIRQNALADSYRQQQQQQQISAIPQPVAISGATPYGTSGFQSSAPSPWMPVQPSAYPPVAPTAPSMPGFDDQFDKPPKYEDAVAEQSPWPSGRVNPGFNPNH